MIWSTDRRFCFVHIPKTGGTSVTFAYEPHMLFNDVVLGGTAYGESIQAEYRNRFGLHKHSFARDIIGVVGEERFRSVFSFAVLRDPIERMVSLYKYLRKNYNPAEKVFRHPLQPYAVENDFAGFAPHGVRQTGAQVDFLFHRKELAVSHLIRLPDLERSWPDICERLGIEFRPLGRRNASGSERVEVGAETRKLLETHYAADFDLYENAGRVP